MTDGVTINQRYGFSASSFDVTSPEVGSVVKQAGLVSNMERATNNCQLLTGTTNQPTGDYCVYQADEYVNRWNSGHRVAYRTISSVDTLTAADHMVLTIGTFNLTLPDNASHAGQQYFITHTTAGTCTVVPAGSDTIQGTATLAVGEGMHIVSFGAGVWIIMGRT